MRSLKRCQAMRKCGSSTHPLCVTSSRPGQPATVVMHCGQSVLPGGVGLWVQRIQETFNPPIYTAVT